MTNTLPVLSGSGLMSFLGNIRPYSDVQPFTYRDGITYQEMLETIRAYLEDYLIPDLTERFDDLNVRDIITAVVTAVSGQDVVVTDAEMKAVLDQPTSQTFAKLTAILDARNGSLWAPAPKGGGQDDTPVINPLALAAQTVGGRVNLRDGTYLVNIATAQSFSQPILTGTNVDKTILKAYDNTKPVVRFKGGSGTLCGGFLQDLTIKASDAGGGIGLQLADTNGVGWARIAFDGTLDTGIEFLNEAASGFTEYNKGAANFKSSVKTAIRYRRATGANAESFHGSGVTEGTLINQVAGATTPMVQIEAGCFPYNAPLTMAVFPRNSSVPIIRNLNTGRKASFYGNIDIEIQGSAANVDIADRAQGIVYYNGTVQCLQSGTFTKLGRLFLTEKVHYNGGNTFVTLKPYHYNYDLVPGDNASPINSVGSGIYSVDIIGSNYHYAYLLYCWQSPYDPTGNVAILATSKTLNTGGIGAPVFTWSNYGLVITNPLFPASGFKAYVSVVPQQTSNNTDRLGQW